MFGSSIIPGSEIQIHRKNPNKTKGSNPKKKKKMHRHHFKNHIIQVLLNYIKSIVLNDLF